MGAGRGDWERRQAGKDRRKIPEKAIVYGIRVEVCTVVARFVVHTFPPSLLLCNLPCEYNAFRGHWKEVLTGGSTRNYFLLIQALCAILSC